MVIHIGSNDITKFNYNNVNAEELAHRIINICLKFTSYAVSNIAVSFILKRSSFNINQGIYQVNNILKLLCRISDFSYICNYLVNEKYLWKEGLHQTNEGSYLLLDNFINYLNGNGNSSIWLMTKSYNIEKSIDIKKNQVTKERCSISQKLISYSNSSSKSKTECIKQLKKSQNKQHKNCYNSNLKCKLSRFKI